MTQQPTKHRSPHARVLLYPGVLWLILAAQIHAQRREVQVHLECPFNQNCESARVSAEIRAQQQGTAKPRAVEQRGQLGQTIGLQLPADGAWLLTAECDGYWSPEEVIVIRQEIVEHLTFRFLPTGTVEGSIDTAEHDPSEARIQFSTPSTVTRSERTLKGSATCSIKASTWACEVPAGVRNLRLTFEGFVSHYLWDIQVPTGGVRRIGPLKLRRGASVSGWVELAEPVTGQVDISVALELAETNSVGAEDGEPSLMTLSASPNEKGFFHLVGVPPGSFDIVARAEGFADARVSPVDVIEGREARLLDPIVLSVPSVLNVFVDPPTDNLGEPWYATLFKVSNRGAMRTIARNTEVSLDGSWHRSNLETGDYRLIISDRSGNAPHMNDALVVSEPEQEVFVQLDLIPVEGRVLIGDTPVEGRLRLEKEDSLARFQTNEEGEFTGHIPSLGKWTAEVTSGSPFIRLKEIPVEAKKRPGRSLAWIEVDLPDTLVKGEVRYSDGSIPSSATVSAVSLSQGGNDGSVESTFVVDKKGTFQIAGVSEGSRLLHAMDTKGAQSEWTSVSLVEGIETSVVLTLRKMKTVKGLIQSLGRPVPNAHVAIQPHSDLTLLRYPTRTDVRGRFAASVPEGTTSVSVAVLAPGFALKTMGAALESDAPIEVELSQIGGDVVLRANEDGPEDGLRNIVLVHNGGVVDALALRTWARLNGAGVSTDFEKIVARALEPGDYSVCRVTQLPSSFASVTGGKCSTLFVVPMGEQTLEVN